jgi:hypothetical protein
VFLRGVGRGEKKQLVAAGTVLISGLSCRYLSFPSIQRALYHWTEMSPSHRFLHLAEKNIWVL